MLRDPIVLLLPHTLLHQGFDLARLIAEDGRWTWAVGYGLLERFALREHEKAFAKAMLSERTNFWLYRTDQRARCGDFIAVDMSSSAPEARVAYVIELKTGASLTVGRKGASTQLSGHRAALSAIAQTSVIAPSTRAIVLVGSPESVLAALADRAALLDNAK